MFLRYDAYMLDLRVWVAVLIVQSIPYLAAVIVSLISAAPRLPAGMIGPMPQMSSADPDGRPIRPGKAGA